VSIKFLKS